MNNNLNQNQTKKKKWFLKWWGILIIIFLVLIILLIIDFVFLVFRYKKAIELGEIIMPDIVGRYSQFDNGLGSSDIIINRNELEFGNQPTLGAEDPVVTIVEFSDFNCPYSAVFYPIIKDFVLEYSDKVRLIFRDFPLYGNSSAMAANCAFEQDKFWEMHDKLFYNQQNISDDLIFKIAEDLKLDMDSFQDCFDNNKYEEEIQSDLTLGVNAGVEGTPTVFINGEKFAGVIPKDIFEQILYAIEYAE